ncbi:hypothetical protein SFB21_1422 [Acinetobacter bouvetii]|uniref:Uncharacterized protein n=2 Tax=Acinetobacter bouvetii TaxID=202951 RepID=A0A811GI46_9GAMM|nr:hypothetical protein SFB21_1422 [Acinetobacter bouvetii]
MRKLLIPIFIFSVLILGYAVYQDSQMKKRQELEQVIQDAHQSLNIVDTNPHNMILGDQVEIMMTDSSDQFILKPKEL